MGMDWVARAAALSLLVGLVACQGGYMAPVCETLSACMCRYPWGSGFDLSNAAVQAYGNPGTNSSAAPLYYFNPCPPSPGTNNTCPENAALCVVQPDSTVKVLGIHSNVTFGKITTTSNATTAKGKPVSTTVQYVQYLYYDDNNNTHTSTIVLKCNYAPTPPSLTEDPTTPGRLVLLSKSACFTKVDLPVADEGLSAGATFLIIFCTLFGAYFFGGMAVLKFIKGAQGVEMIPNYEFWSSLPSLVKDGFLFAVAGCRGAASYDRI